MDVSPHAVLVATRDEYDAANEPIGTQQIAAAVGTTPRQIQPILDSLCRNEFLSQTAEGYRLTVTAREFLELNIKLSDVVVIDTVNK